MIKNQVQEFAVYFENYSRYPLEPIKLYTFMDRDSLISPLNPP